MSSERWQVPILMYHHVSPDIDRYTNTPPALFERQMACIARSFRFWTVGEAHAAFRAGGSPAGRVVLTFDDGYEDVARWACPVLDDLGIRATFFVLPRYAGRDNGWNPTCGYRCRHLDWGQIRALHAKGHEIGSHGLSHRRMDEMDRAAAAHELSCSRELVRQHIGVAPRSFAYPYGWTNEGARSAAAEIYDVALSTTKSAHADWSTSRHALRRTYIPQTASNSDVLGILAREARA